MDYEPYLYANWLIGHIPKVSLGIRIMIPKRFSERIQVLFTTYLKAVSNSRPYLTHFVDNVFGKSYAFQDFKGNMRLVHQRDQYQVTSFLHNKILFAIL